MSEDTSSDNVTDRKNVCPLCGSGLRAVGPISGTASGEAFACEDESCKYEEHRFYE